MQLKIINLFIYYLHYNVNLVKTYLQNTTYYTFLTVTHIRVNKHIYAHICAYMLARHITYVRTNHTYVLTMTAYMCIFAHICALILYARFEHVYVSHNDVLLCTYMLSPT